MAPIGSIAGRYIEENKIYFLEKYYKRHKEGAVILLFNKDGSFYSEHFRTKAEILESRELPGNAYSEAREYWDKNPIQLVFMSWFTPITGGVPFNVYVLGTITVEIPPSQLRQYKQNTSKPSKNTVNELAINKQNTSQPSKNTVNELAIDKHTQALLIIIGTFVADLFLAFICALFLPPLFTFFLFFIVLIVSYKLLWKKIKWLNTQSLVNNVVPIIKLIIKYMLDDIKENTKTYQVNQKAVEVSTEAVRVNLNKEQQKQIDVIHNIPTAYDYYSQSIKNNSNDEYCYYYRSKLRSEQGDGAGAVADFQKYVEICQKKGHNAFNEKDIKDYTQQLLQCSLYKQAPPDFFKEESSPTQTHNSCTIYSTEADNSQNIANSTDKFVVTHVNTRETQEYKTSKIFQFNISLLELYSTTPLSQGMFYIAESIKQDNYCLIDHYNYQSYDEKLELWLEEINYEERTRYAMDLKRQGKYERAFSIYNELFQIKPWFPRTHYSAFKTLVAVHRFEEAYSAIQLWCLAIVPEVVFRHPQVSVFLEDKTKLLDVKQNLEICRFLYLWSNAVPDGMYHLGNMGMLKLEFLSPSRTLGYVKSLSGAKFSIDLQQTEKARCFGEKLAAKLPWMSISTVVEGDCWREIFTATHEVTKRSF
jgi:hypothetical protein